MMALGSSCRTGRNSFFTDDRVTSGFVVSELHHVLRQSFPGVLGENQTDADSDADGIIIVKTLPAPGELVTVTVPP